MNNFDKLTDRVREMIAETHHITEEKKMFGGICFMVNDKMCVGLAKEKLMVRFHPDRYEEIMERDDAEPMDFTGKVMKGYVFVDPDNLRTRRQLAFWIGLALAYNKEAPVSKKKNKGPVKKKK